MTVADVQKCNAGSITKCPADRALYDTRSVTCESRLYFQTLSKDGLCKRSLMVRYRKPTFLRNEEVWVFHFPSQRQVNIRCPRNNEWVTRTQTLSGAGLIQNATRCSTSGEIRCPGTTRRRARQPRRPVSKRARQLANTAGTWDVSTHITSACCLMLPAHQRDHRRQYTPVPDAPRSGSSKPDSHRLCGTTR